MLLIRDIFMDNALIYQTTKCANSTALHAQFRDVAKQITKPISKKSYTQVASSVAHHVAQSVQHDGSHHSAGRSPIPHKSEKSCTHGLRLKSGELELIKQKAVTYRMNVNSYIRAKALGEDYIEKPPEELRDVLLKLYVELAGQGNNLNQIARKVNMKLATAETALGLVDHHRQPVFQALEKLELALAGRRPPDDY